MGGDIGTEYLEGFVGIEGEVEALVDAEVRLAMESLFFGGTGGGGFFVDIVGDEDGLITGGVGF